MSSDSEIEIPGYTHPLSLLCIDLTATNSRKRQSSLLDFTVSSGQSHCPLNKNQAIHVLISNYKEIIVPKESLESKEICALHAPPQEKATL